MKLEKKWMNYSFFTYNLFEEISSLIGVIFFGFDQLSLPNLFMLVFNVT